VGDVKIVLADDHAVVRSALRLLLDSEHDLEVVAEAGDVGAATLELELHQPDVLVLDLHLPDGPSLPSVPRLREASPQTGIVVLTMQREPSYAREALRAGVLGYVLKDAVDEDLVNAVRLAAKGRSYLQPELGAQLAVDAGDDPDGLSEREIDVLRLIALGYTNTEIAERLLLSVRTVESHRAHVQRKLGMTKRSQLVRYALERRMLDTEPA
jgi:two-component system response regulator NreC